MPQPTQRELDPDTLRVAAGQTAELPLRQAPAAPPAAGMSAADRGCPECRGGPLYHAEGCIQCLGCGWSACGA